MPAPSGKAAVTAVPLHPLLSERWSPRGFDAAHELDDDHLTALLEAARWAPSASNSQPWRFLVARRGEAAFEAVCGALAPGNQAWADAASALVVTAAVTTGPEGTPRPWAAYDTGQAVALLTVQAQHEGLGVHQLGGFDRAEVAERLELPAGVEPLVVLAVGLRAERHRLAEPFATRESAARERLPLAELLLPVPAHLQDVDRRLAETA